MNKKKLIVFLLLFNCLILQSHFAIVMAQTTDEDVAESERQKTIAENKKAAQDALFPKPDVGSLVGTTVTNGNFVESQMLGYCAMKSAAQGIAKQISESSLPNSATFIVYNEEDVKMLSRYRLLLTRLTFLENGFRTILPPAANRALGVGLAINTALNYLSLLKTDITLTGTDVNITEKELVAEIFGQLRQAPGKTYTLYYTKTIPMPLCTNNDFRQCSQLFNQIINTVVAYEDANAVTLTSPVDDAKISLRKQLNTAFLQAMKELGLPVELTPAPTPAPAPAPAPAQNSQTTTVTVNVGDKKEEGGGGGGSTAFSSYLQTEALYNLISQANTYWIDMQVVKAGGNMRVRTNFITNFFIGSRVNFSGGAIAYFNIFDKDSKSRVSGIFQSYEKYRKSSQINATCNQQQSK